MLFELDHPYGLRHEKAANLHTLLGKIANGRHKDLSLYYKTSFLKHSNLVLTCILSKVKYNIFEIESLRIKYLCTFGL